MMSQTNRIRILGIFLASAGLAMAGAGFAYGLPMANDGLASAQAMYEAQGVTLAYNEQGQLVDRGTTEGAGRILALLEGDWKFPVNRANLDPNDPVVNTRDELMFQYATITYHVLHGEVDVKLAAEQVPITYRGVTYDEAGTYKIAPLAYYAQLDRTHLIEGQLRAAWTPQALALTAALAGGHANQAAGELAQATSLAIAGIGLLFATAGGGLAWATFSRDAAAKIPARAPVAPVMDAPRGGT
ncbi:MAG TPA: hypothetical protein VHH36_01150 [Candidatus Thermoplasmatota archaeon]|nr:hypothetical protein [Candidatus Thermoplasmatota archaeon]